MGQATLKRQTQVKRASYAQCAEIFPGHESLPLRKSSNIPTLKSQKGKVWQDIPRNDSLPWTFCPVAVSSFSSSLPQGLTFGLRLGVGRPQAQGVALLVAQAAAYGDADERQTGQLAHPKSTCSTIRGSWVVQGTPNTTLV